MRTDITKINEQSPHQDLTEGLMVFAGGTSKLLIQGSGGLIHQSFIKINVNSAFCVHQYALTAAYLSKMAYVGILTMTTVRDVVSVQRLVHLVL